VKKQARDRKSVAKQDQQEIEGKIKGSKANKQEIEAKPSISPLFACFFAP
jgi:hypothetical protein